MLVLQFLHRSANLLFTEKEKQSQRKVSERRRRKRERGVEFKGAERERERIIDESWEGGQEEDERQRER